jgi:hypothetical protein
LTLEEIVEVDGRLKGCSPFASELLVFTPETSSQTESVLGMLEPLRQADVHVVLPQSLRSGFSAEAYSEGEGYGYLRWLPAEMAASNCGPHDIAVVDLAPNDLGLVAGLISEAPQSQASHLNLRLREKGIPSASVPSIRENALLFSLADRLVRVSVSTERVVIEPAQLEDAEAFWAAREPPRGAPDGNLGVTEMRSLQALRSADAEAFGAKAANLGELCSILEAEHRVEGFAIPFQRYVDFMQQHGLTAVRDAMLNDPQVRLHAEHKRKRLSDLRERIRAAELDDAFVEELRRTVEATFGAEGLVTRLRFRSSTNAEDLPGVSGAGLYRSASGCLADDQDDDDQGPSHCLSAEHQTYLEAEQARYELELSEHPDRSFLSAIIEDLREDLTEEKSARLAIKRVWASLWNERAFEDREYYGIDHAQVFMGIAVHPTFVGEQRESVAFTNLEPSSEAPLYRVVSQLGETGVVEPQDPTATPEILTFRRSPEDAAAEVTLVTPSSLSPGGAGLWAAAEIDILAGLLFTVQDHFASTVYPAIDPLSLDLEVDVTMDGRTVVKQARPYLSASMPVD